MKFVTTRAKAVWLALRSLHAQFWLWVDQGVNAIGLGLLAVLAALWTGEEQATCYADETLSAHAYRASKARKHWPRVTLPAIDWIFFWQGTNPRVDQIAGRRVTGHCERAFWKKVLRLGLPEEYQ